MPGNGCKNSERVNHNHLSSAVYPYPIHAAQGCVLKGKILLPMHHMRHPKQNKHTVDVLVRMTEYISIAQTYRSP